MCGPRMGTIVFLDLPLRGFPFCLVPEAARGGGTQQGVLTILDGPRYSIDPSRDTSQKVHAALN